MSTAVTVAEGTWVEVTQSLALLAGVATGDLAYVASILEKRRFVVRVYQPVHVGGEDVIWYRLNADPADIVEELKLADARRRLR